MIIRKCLVCGFVDSFDDDADEDMIRASCLPCGHQGLFELKRNKRKMDNESRLREIKKCKDILKNLLLGYNQRVSLELYLKSLEEEKC